MAVYPTNDPELVEKLASMLNVDLDAVISLQNRDGEHIYSFNIQVYKYRIYSINCPGRLVHFWTLRVGTYSRLGTY